MTQHSFENPWPYSYTFLHRLLGLCNLRHLVSVVLTRTGLAPLFTIRIGGVRLRFFPSAMSILMWENRDAYSEDPAFLRRYLKPDDIFVDVGANIGYLTITGAKAVGPNGKVFSFEAHPRIFGYLQENVALNGLSNVTARNVAVGNTNGTVDLLECPGDDSQSCVAHGNGAVAIPMVSLDDIFPNPEPVALLKIDVEGYEKFVLEGADRLLSSTICIYFECAPSNLIRYGYTCKTLLDVVERAGFVLYRLEDGVCRRLCTDYTPASICENLIGVRNSEELFARTGYSASS
jgi:FkbM family methyltransferase